MGNKSKQSKESYDSDVQIYSKKPEVAAIELLDGAYDIIEIFDAKTPAQIAWKKAWLIKARELGANPSW
jgi:hypothetical protein